MIDAHCHLYEIEESVWKNSGLEAMICAGADLETSKKAVELAQKYPEVWATVGIHPDGNTKFENLNSKQTLKTKLLNLIKHKKVVAIGECGLDTDDPAEEELLKLNMDLAREVRLPLVVHNRHQDEGILRIVNHDKVMLHCFTSDIEFMRTCTQRGWYISFSGILTFKKSDSLRAVAQDVPEHLLLAETDSPYLSPEPLRGSINHPQNVKIVLEQLARIRRCSFIQIAQTTTANAKRLFALP